MAKSFRERIGDLLDLVREPLAEYGMDRLKARYGEDWQEGALDALGRDRHGHTVDDPREWDNQAWFNFYIGVVLLLRGDSDSRGSQPPLRSEGVPQRVGPPGELRL